MAAQLDMAQLTNEGTLTRARLVRTVLLLSVPAILSELTTTLMQYIDAAMVGGLGAEATAAIGLVESAVWLLDGWVMCVATGFTVQVAQLVGAARAREAKDVLRQAIVSMVALGVLIALLGVCVSGALPAWLGGDAALHAEASRYFLICSLAILPVGLSRLSTGMLQCAGDMRTPSVINVFACVLDVALNALLIPDRWDLSLLGRTLVIDTLGLGVAGAALATLLAQTITCCLLLYASCVRSPLLALTSAGDWVPRAATLRRAITVAGPMLVERTVMSLAYIAGTVIVAPLGTVAVAANSLAVTAEALCYMPGLGVGVAATTLVGQAVGARRPDLAMRFARMSCLVGMALLAVTGTVMYLCAPQIMDLLTIDAEVAALGVEVLRIEAFAEPLFAASIVCAGALRGAADTLVPSLICLACMWGVRLTAASALAPAFGLAGVWFAMAAELCLRGALFLVRLLRGRWAERACLV